MRREELRREEKKREGRNKKRQDFIRLDRRQRAEMTSEGSVTDGTRKEEIRRGEGGGRRGTDD